MPQDSAVPKIQIDSDWKAQAQAEKERLSEREAAREAQRDERGQKLPEASFRSLIGMLASQAIMGLGTMTDPKSGGVIVDLDGARFSIDLLSVLEEKTKGNLSKEEGEELKQLLAELRAQFIEISHLLAQAAQRQRTTETKLTAGEPMKPAAPKSKLIVPD